MKKAKVKKLFRKLFSGIDEEKLRAIVRLANQEDFFYPHEDPDFQKFHEKVWDFLKTGVTNDAKDYTRLYQIMDEGDFEPQDRAYLTWLTKRVQSGKGKYKAYTPILDALEGMSIMLDEDSK